MAPSLVDNGGTPPFTPEPESGYNDPPLSACPEPIAICGMACRWPGGASNPSKLWDLLAEKRSGYGEFKDNKLNLDGFYHPNQHRPGSIFTKGGYFLSENPKEFDHSLFGITPLETMTMDPAQRKLLECTYESIENAGETWDSVSGSRTGVFVGNFNYDHQLMQIRDADHTLPYVTTGGGITILSNRINYVFNLKGPSLTIDTACSSSMYALHLAVTAIRGGECDAALVGGSNLILGPEAQLFSTKLGAISPTSKSHTFDAAADGYARADGFGCLYLKKLSTAIANGDPVRTVIRGTAINANGRTGGISHPSPEGQEEVMRRAYESAGGLDPDLTGYFECHGTGTPVGDPLEVTAIGRMFSSGRQKEPLLIGSIKTNLGHSESSSGIAGIMKAVMAIEHGVIPPTIGLVNPNPNINFDKAKVKVVTEMTPWPSKPIRRASVNSFGYGGANAHCILEHVNSIVPGYRLQGVPKSTNHKPPANSSTNGTNGHRKNGNGTSGVETRYSQDTNGEALKLVQSSQPIFIERQSLETRRLVLLPMSGNDETALEGNINALRDAIDDYNLADVAFTLAARRSRYPHRSVAIADANRPQKALSIETMTSGKSQAQVPKLGFVFTGQGAQWPRMGAELFQEYAVFRKSIKYQDKVLSKLSRRPKWTIEKMLLEPAESSHIQEPELSQPMCTSLQIALVDLLKSWNITPVATVGHSSGEIAAAYAAGLHTAAEAITMAYFRGQVVAANTRKGLMLAAGLGEDLISPYLEGRENDIKIAAVNSPESVTLSGEQDAIQAVLTQLEDKGIFARVLKTGGNAYHSHHMEALGESYEALARQGLKEIQDFIALERISHTHVLWVSSVTSKPVSKKQVGPAYWRSNLESPVLFSHAVQKLAEQTEVQFDLLVELGPHPALSGPLKQIRGYLQESKNLKLPPCLGSLVRGKDALESILTLGGNLFIKNASVDLKAINAIDIIDGRHHALAHGALAIDLPNYAYHYGPVLYYENRYNQEWRLRKHLRHDLLGAKQPGCAKNRPSWRNMLRLKDVPWLEDHKLLPHPVFPAAGYLAMATEALAQFHYEQENAPKISGFSLRSVAVNSTLEVPDDDFGIETILNLQATDLTTSKSSSKWHNFKISSVLPGSSNWTEHVSGHICIEMENKEDGESFVTDSRARSIDIKRWYAKFHEVGLGYGPAFQGLSNLRAYRGTNAATANVALKPITDTVKGGESSYFIHPATMDTCLQLALIACHAGQVEKVKHAFVPIVVDEMSIWINEKPPASVAGIGKASGEIRGLRGAYAQTQLFDQSSFQILNIKQLRCVAYDGGAGVEVPRFSRDPYLKLVWKPDITTLTNESAKNIFTPVRSAEEITPVFDKFDRLSAYILVQFNEVQAHLFEKKHSEHLEMFVAWVRRCVASAKAGTLKYGPEAVSSSITTRDAVIEQLTIELDDVVEAKLIKRIYDALPKIFTHETSGLHIALKDNLLSELYISGIGISAVYPQLLRLIDLLSHKNPRMKIIEVGAGTGGATRLVLNELAGRSNFKRYSSYTFTDVTPSFLSAAQEEFAACRGMTFNTLNIEADPIVQGYEGTYDLVLASQVLHATATISETLQNVRKLLKTGGKMILVEITRVHIGTGLVLGTFPDYWNGAHEGRVDSPLMNKNQWNCALLENGFSGLDIALDDYAEEVSMASVLLTTAVEPKTTVPKYLTSGLIYLVFRKSPSSIAQTVQSELQYRGFSAFHIPLVDDIEDRVPLNSRIISFVDIEDQLTNDIDAEELKALKKLIKKAKSLVWVSSGSLVRGGEPKAAIMVGLLRAITTETPSSRFTSIDLDKESEIPDENVAAMIISKEGALQGKQEPSVDGEYVMNSGSLHVSRLVPNEVANLRFRRQIGFDKDLELHAMDTQGPLAVNYDQPGLLSSLYFKSDESFAKPLKEGWIDIETKAIGLNIKDMAVATGRFDWNKFSTECAGVVRQVGPGVKHLRAGDFVYGPAPGNFGNFVRCFGESMQKMSPSDKFEEVASLPVVYMTAVYAFMHLARLKKGESVLIQSATGGLGMAAIRIAKYLGAEIFATVGTPEKVKVLTEEFGIPSDHIFNSREVSASFDIMKATGKKGIDVILCSAAGEMMHETWGCIAPMGRFIEVGRTDILGHGKLSLEIFSRNASFSSFDLGLLNQQKPEFVAGLMGEVGQLYREGIVKPIDHITTFDISNLEQALMYFAKGTHLGKVVVTFEDPSARVKVRPIVERPKFDANVTYLLVGCLGGLGRSISSWMAERGARHLTYVSRSGSDRPEAIALLLELADVGVATEVVKCDITSLIDLKAAVKKISSSRPIKGVIHAAMVEGDSTFENMELNQLKSVLAPKVTGSINLHQATLGCDLDFFTMTSSIVTMIGTATQGAYCAANAFQDSLARSRKSQGLPSQSIALGLILEVGFVSELPEVQKSLERNGVYGTSEYEFLEIFEASFLGQKELPTTGHDPFTSAHSLMGLEPSKLVEFYESGIAAEFTWHTDARFSNLLQAIEDQSHSQSITSTGGSVIEKLKNASPAEMHSLATEAIVERLAKLLFIPTDEIEPIRAVSDYGMDSMIAAELRNWIVKTFQTDISFLDLLNPQTKIGVLAEMVLKT